MFNISADEHRKKLGCYYVDGDLYSNKYLALEKKKENSEFKYDFNDDVFSAYDWSVEPSQDLYEIYKERALQLREKYEHLILFFSGGIDSTVILLTFLENNIPLDGVVMYGTWKFDDKYQTHLDTVEQNRVGIPLIRALEKKYNKKINLYLLDTADLYKKFNDDEFAYATNSCYVGPRMYCQNHYWDDPWMQDWINRGSTAFIRGIDKPRVILENNEWYLGFLDVQIIDPAQPGNLNSKKYYATTEYFYWTPDLPKLLAKQAHIIINYLEKNLPADAVQKLTTMRSEFNSTTYYKYVDPLVYGKYLTQQPGQDRNYFSLPKSMAPGIIQKDFWFYDLGPTELKKQFEIWKQGMKRLQSDLPLDMINLTTNKNNVSDYNKWLSELFQEYNITDLEIPKLGEPHIIWGVKGTWSKLHKIKNFDTQLTV